MRWPAKRILTQSDKGFGMYQAAAALEARGADVIHLEVGRPSFDTPLHIKEAAKKALDDGIVHYGDLQGSRHLREALAIKVRDYNALDVAADEILITNGLTQASFAAFMAALEEGDEAIVLEPYYPQHGPKIELIGGRVVSVPLDKENGFRLNPKAVAAAITPRTRLLVFVNPANPVGRVFTREEITGLAHLAVEHDLLVVTDEVYDYIVYDGRRHISIASLPGMADRTISLFAFTKAYAMDGWRIGYAAAGRRFIEAMMKVTLNETTHPCVFAQEGAYAAVTSPQACVEEMVAEDCRRRDLVHERLNEMPGVNCTLPEGAIYAFPDFSELDISAGQLARDLLQDAHVATEQGSFYGRSGEGHLRLCFGSQPFERLEEALNRIERHVKTIGARKTGAVR